MKQLHKCQHSGRVLSTPSICHIIVTKHLPPFRFLAVFTQEEVELSGSRASPDTLRSHLTAQNSTLPLFLVPSIFNWAQQQQNWWVVSALMLFLREANVRDSLWPPG